MLRKAGILLVASALGAGSALGVTACGEERGDVQIEGDTGDTGATATGGTETARTGTSGTETERTTTAK